MSLRILLAGRQLELLPGASLSLEIHSALFAEEVFRGAYSYSFTLPLNDPNREVFGFPDVVENRADLRRAFAGCDVEWDGHALGRNGELRIRRVRPDRVEATVAFGLSQVASELSERKLASFELGGVRSVTPIVEGIPGLVLHAVDTVNSPQLYDYVFAPFVNCHYATEATPAYPAVPFPVVNSWVFTRQALFGAPERGCFSYYIPFTVMGLPPLFEPPVQPSMTPLPKLRFVLRSVFAELGLRVESDVLTGELGQLVMLSGAQAGYEFNLADCMPNLTTKELLLKLRETIGLVPDVDALGRLHLLLLQDIVNADEYEDWTAVAAEQLDEREVSDAQGITLTYSPAADDEPAAAFYKAPARLPVGVPAATKTALPVSGPLTAIPADELRFVEDERMYYRSQVQISYGTNLFLYNWQLSGSEFLPVDIAGGGEEQAQGVTAVAVVRLDTFSSLADYTEYAVYPAIKRKQFLPTQPDEDRGAELQLAFYRGRQPYAISANHPNADLNPDYPLVTPLNLNAKGEEAGTLSLQLHGEAGTVANFLGDWLRLMATATPVKWRVWLTPEQLANPRLQVRKRIAGNDYLVRKISVSVPMTRPAIVELVPIPASLGR